MLLNKFPVPLKIPKITPVVHRYLPKSLMNSTLFLNVVINTYYNQILCIKNKLTKLCLKINDHFVQFALIFAMEADSLYASKCGVYIQLHPLTDWYVYLSSFCSVTIRNIIIMAKSWKYVKLYTYHRWVPGMMILRFQLALVIYITHVYNRLQLNFRHCYVTCVLLWCTGSTARMTLSYSRL